MTSVVGLSPDVQGASILLADIASHNTMRHYVTACSSAAACTWLFWDMCLTLKQESEYVWRVRRSMAKYVYYFIRGGSLVLQGTNLARNLSIARMPSGNFGLFNWRKCMLWSIYNALTSLALHLSVEYVLTLRVYALYSQHKVLRKIIVTLFPMKAMIMAVSLAIYSVDPRKDAHCHNTSKPVTMYLYTAVTVMFHIFLFVLILVKFAIGVRAGWGNTPIIVLITRDGIWSFFALFAFMLIYGFTIAFVDHSWNQVLYSWIVSVFSLVGYRNLLNIFKFSKNSGSRASKSDEGASRKHIFSSNIFTQHIPPDSDLDYLAKATLSRSYTSTSGNHA